MQKGINWYEEKKHEIRATTMRLNCLQDLKCVVVIFLRRMVRRHNVVTLLRYIVGLPSSRLPIWALHQMGGPDDLQVLGA